MERSAPPPPDDGPPDERTCYADSLARELERLDPETFDRRVRRARQRQAALVDFEDAGDVRAER